MNRLGVYQGPPTYRTSPPKRYIVDERGCRWPELGLVRGACEDHWLCLGPGGEPPCGWESDLFPSRFPKGPVQKPFVSPDGQRYSGSPLRGLGGIDSACGTGSDAGYGGACSLPTLPGFLVFGVLGAFAAGRGKRLQGALNGTFGAWISCAAGKALGLSEGATTVLTVAGAYGVARVYRG